MPHRKSVTQCKCSKRNWQCLQAFLGLCVCARPQLPVPIWMERSTLLWDRVCVWCGAQPPSPLRPRLHLHPTSKWILLPVPPGGCGALLRERLQNGFITEQWCLFFNIFLKTRSSLFNHCFVRLPVQLLPSVIRSSAATSLHGCHSHPRGLGTGLSCSCSSSLYRPMASLSTLHNISVPELVRTFNPDLF